MLTSKAKFSANAATTFGLATTVAALWMAAVPFAGAVADVQISAARAAAIQECWCVGGFRFEGKRYAQCSALSS